MGVCLEQLRKHSQPRRHSWDGCQNNPGLWEKARLSPANTASAWLDLRMPRVTSGGKINSPLVWNVCPFSRGTWETASNCGEEKPVGKLSSEQENRPPAGRTAIVSPVGMLATQPPKIRALGFRMGQGCCPCCSVRWGLRGKGT